MSPRASDSKLLLQFLHMPTPGKPKPASKTPKPTRAKPTDTLKIPGTFNELITRSLTTKKPPDEWPKERAK